MTILPLLALLSSAAPKTPPAKYVFLFIGDGMGLGQVALAEAYQASVAGDTLGFQPMAFSEFPVLGMATTHCANRRITESAAAATAFASGSKASDGSLGLDPHDNTPLRTIAEDALAHKRGIGILTTTSIDHATPAAFYAHVTNRNHYYEIGAALTRSGMDVFAGGSFRDPHDRTSKTPGASLWSLAEKAGYEVVRGRKALESRMERKVLAFASPAARDSAVPYEIDRSRGSSDQPRLVDFVRETSRLLEGPNGFFVMAEGGKIDWACHRNDARSQIEEVKGLDSAVRAALAFARKHSGEVLIVVTADHETGGLSLGNGRLGYQSNLGLLRHQRASQETLEDSLLAALERKDSSFATHLAIVARETGLATAPGLDLSREDSATLLEAHRASLKPGAKGAWGTYHPLAWSATRMLSDKAGVGWTTLVHTAIPVPVYAWGAGAEAFRGRMDNIDLARRLRRAMGIPTP
jgi:alkaline phosphatase